MPKVRDRLRRPLSAGDEVMVNDFHRGPRGVVLLRFLGVGTVVNFNDGLADVRMGRERSYRLPEQLIKLG